MKEYVAHRRIVRMSDEEKQNAEYLILAETLYGEDGRHVCECYGIAIRTDRGEQAKALAITVSLRRIEKITRMLAENEVLPCGLTETLENCIELLER